MIEYSSIFPFVVIIFLGIIIYLINEIRIKDNDINLLKETINSYKEKLAQMKNDNLLLQQKAVFVERQSDKMIEQFKSLSHETVASQSFSFIKVIEDHIHKIKTTNQEENFKNKSSIKEVLLPMENVIHNFEKIINSFENKTSIDNREIFSKLSQVINTSFNLQQEVNKVINSLRSPNVKGIWGEMQLKRLVQICGMEEHCDFQWQSTIEKGLKPDMVINLPNGKQIIVDSKVSLSAYINCMDTNDDEKKKYYLQDHARQIKQHINSLYNKRYWENMENCANFVILFLPGECFLSAALEVNPSMLEYASKYNIILATPTTMIGLLKTIGFGWENIHISKDIEKIKFILQNLYSELSTVLEDMGAMGKIIESLNAVYKNTYHTIDCNLKYTLEEIHHKYSITFQNNLKEEKTKKTKIPDSIKQELKNKNNNIKEEVGENILHPKEDIFNEQSDESGLTERSKERVLTERNEEKIFTERSKERVLTERNEEIGLPERNEEIGLTERNEEIGLTERNEERELTEQSKERGLTENSEKKIFTEQSEAKELEANNDGNLFTKSESLNATKSLDETKSSLDETKSSLNETKSLLDETKSSLDETKSLLDETKSSLDETKSSLDETLIINKDNDLHQTQSLKELIILKDIFSEEQVDNKKKTQGPINFQEQIISPSINNNPKSITQDHIIITNELSKKIPLEYPPIKNMYNTLEENFANVIIMNDVDDNLNFNKIKMEINPSFQDKKEKNIIEIPFSNNNYYNNNFLLIK
jgi:DNA recombination protein RmuC